jgi:exosome complex RNA-binding protein Rrp4
MNKLVQQQLLRAQQRMKSQADKKIMDRSFQVGDSVYLKQQPYNYNLMYKLLLLDVQIKN